MPEKSDETQKVARNLFLFTLLSLVIAFSFTLSIAFYSSIDIRSSVEPSIVNGLLTGFSIVFAFVSYEIREIKTTYTTKFLLSLPLMSFFISAITIYVSNVVSFGYPTLMSLLAAFSGANFCVYYFVVIMYAKDNYQKYFDN